MELIRFLVIGVAAGWIMGKIRRGRGYGIIGNLCVGTVGSLIGWFMMGLLKIEASNLLAQIAMAVAGAIVFFLLVGSFAGRRSRKNKEEDE
jgi:uncharacterized membrane protein YeaQ/YmgE (transglycosylase-associated protein family)